VSEENDNHPGYRMAAMRHRHAAAADERRRPPESTDDA
jgi:hypothetical protein